MTDPGIDIWISVSIILLLPVKSNVWPSNVQMKIAINTKILLAGLKACILYLYFVFCILFKKNSVAGTVWCQRRQVRMLLVRAEQEKPIGLCSQIENTSFTVFADTEYKLYCVRRYRISV